MAERDIEKTDLIEHDMYKTVLLKLWLIKTKDEKQAFISKFIDTAVLKKNENGKFYIEKINFRNSFIEQLEKLYEKGLVDFPNMIERDGKLEDVKISVNMNNKQLEDYLEAMKKNMNVNYLDLGEYHFYDGKVDVSYDSKSKIAKIKDKAIEFKLKKNQKVIRLVALKEAKNYLAKPEQKLHLGVVTYTK